MLAGLVGGIVTPPHSSPSLAATSVANRQQGLQAADLSVPLLVKAAMRIVREHLLSKSAPADPLFRWRGHDVSRLEGMSDAVFAFALTLLVVSAGPPSTFHDLWITLRDLPAFAACFASLFAVWYQHYLFFRRFGLQDLLTITLNLCLLFVVLFYVYPLKFMYTYLWRLVLGDDLSPLFHVPPQADGAGVVQDPMLTTIVVFSLGVLGTFGLLTLLCLRALALRNELELDRLEVFLTWSSIRANLVWCTVAATSLLLARYSPPLAGLIYFALGPLHGTLGYWQGRRAERIYRELHPQSA